IEAISIPGMRVSMPNMAEPVTFAGASVRRGGFPGRGDAAGVFLGGGGGGGGVGGWGGGFLGGEFFFFSVGENKTRLCAGLCSGEKTDPVGGRAFGEGKPPGRRGSSHEHFSRRSAALAKRIKRAANAAAAAGDLVAIFGIKIGLNDFHAALIAGKFFGDQHKKGGLHALTHFGVAAPDGDRSPG